MAVAELCRMHGFSDASFYKWWAKYGGMEADEANDYASRESRTVA
jgi:putative transposase